MIISLKGESNTAKSSFPLTGPHQILYLETDPGGFNRAFLECKDDIINGNIVFKSYPLPKEVLRAALVKQDKGFRIRGMKELWGAFVEDFCTGLESPDIKLITVDTYSQMHQILMAAYLQEKQEAQEVNGKLPVGKTYRENLTQIEYGQINSRMHTMLDQANVYDKNMVIIHHMTDVWGPVMKDGKIDQGVVGRDAKGWKNCGYAASDLADIVLETKRTTVTSNKGPITSFSVVYTKAPPALMGVTVENPTWDKIVKQVKFVKG